MLLFIYNLSSREDARALHCRIDRSDRMKKLVTTILTLCVILGMTGCGKKAEQETGCYSPIAEDGIWYCSIADSEHVGEFDEAKWMEKVLKDEGLTTCSSKLVGEQVTEIKVPEAAKEMDGDYEITIHSIKGKETSKVKIAKASGPKMEEEYVFVAPEDYLISEYHAEF